MKEKILYAAVFCGLLNSAAVHASSNSVLASLGVSILGVALGVGCTLNNDFKPSLDRRLFSI